MTESDTKKIAVNYANQIGKGYTKKIAVNYANLDRQP